MEVLAVLHHEKSYEDSVDLGSCTKQPFSFPFCGETKVSAYAEVDNLMEKLDTHS